MTRRRGEVETRRIAGVILAGGKNRRFPTLKAFINIEGSPIIERNLRLLKGIFDEVFISTNMPEMYFYLSMPLIGDVLPSRGPMSGIYSSLINAKSDCIFVIACDMPFVETDVVSFICKKHIEVFKGGLHKGDLKSPLCVDATIPVYNGEPQPLLGVYCKTALTYLENRVLNEKTSMRRLLSEINTHFIGESDIMTVDPDGRSFVNINTMEDYERIAHGSWLMAHSKKL
jgi:molybdopterin-guanine dinucleotide biosynthesis protein A